MVAPIANAGLSPSPIAWSSNPGSYVLSGSGTPGTGATSITGYQWTILSQPTNGTAALNDDTLQAPTLSPLPARGTVLLFLVVEDNLGNFSEQDPTQAPNSAFWRISIRTRYLGVEIPSPGQRDWADEYENTIDVIDVFKQSFNAHTIASHDTTATGTQLTTLTSGGSAAGLHTHPGGDFTTLAAVGVLGKIECASAPADPAHPKAVTQLLFHQMLQTTTAAAKLVSDGQEVFVFQVPTTSTLINLEIVAADGWNGQFHVYVMTESAYLSGTFGAASGSVTLSNSGARVRGAMSPTPNIPLSGKDYIVVTRSTPTSTPGSPTRHMTCFTTLRRQY